MPLASHQDRTRDLHTSNLDLCARAIEYSNILCDITGGGMDFEEARQTYEGTNLTLTLTLTLRRNENQI